MNLIKLHQKKKSNAGFTLVELMVSIAIMIIILAVVMVNYGKFDTGIVLTNLSYDIGLSIRKAQSYGISVKGVTVSNNQIFDYSYGIHFDTANPKSYTIFADVNGNGIYDPGVAGEKVESFMIGSSYQVVGLYQSNSGGRIAGGLSSVDITFKRPNPDATVHVNGSGSTTSNAIEIDIASTRDLTVTKTIVVRSTGQISIQ